MERTWLLLAGLLVLLTLGWGRVERFEAVGPLISDGGPIDAAHGWSVSTRGARVTPLPDGVRIELVGPSCEQDRGCHATISKAGPVGPPGLARTTAVATWTGVRRQAPRTFGLHGSVREILGTGKRGAGWPLRDQRRVGSSEPVLVEGLSRLEQSGERWEVWWALSGISGVAELREVRASAVRVRPLWSVGVALLGLGWCVWAAAGLWSLRRESAHPRVWFVAAALTAGVLLGTLTPDVVLDPVRKPLQVSIRSAVKSMSAWNTESSARAPAPAPATPSTQGDWSAPEPAPMPVPVVVKLPSPSVPTRPLPPPPSVWANLFEVLSNVDKIGHLLFFTALSAMSFVSAPPARRRTVVVAILLLAVGTELLQGFTLDRTSRWLDVGLDGVGLVAGYFGVGILQWAGVVGSEHQVRGDGTTDS